MCLSVLQSITVWGPQMQISGQLYTVNQCKGNVTIKGEQGPVSSTATCAAWKIVKEFVNQIMKIVAY